jgi:hypothetical protein
MSGISLREMTTVLSQYTILPGAVPQGLRAIANAIVSDHVGVAFPFSCSNLSTLLAGPRILQVISDPPPDHQGASWTSDIVNGKRWFTDSDGPDLAWVQVQAPNDTSWQEYDAPVIAVAGTVISPKESDNDFPFHHPFGNDWECYVDVDPKFRGVLSPVNGSSGEQDYHDAAQKAPHAPETGSHQGVLGVEWDAQLVPSQFRPTEGDRIVLFGRWILDAGHNFHTEIHPPLMMVTASGGVFTHAKITSRPYLVSQRWNEGSFRNHLIAEVAKVPAESLRLEAHPYVSAMPFSGRQSMTFVVRTNTTPLPGKTLQVQYALTARSGVSVSMVPALPDGVQVQVTFDSASYQSPDLPPQTHPSISVDELAKQAGEQTAVDWAQVAEAILNPAGEVIIAEGILTDSYTLPPSMQPPYPTPPRTVDLARLSGVVPVTVNDQQPYPLIGDVWILIS